MAKKNQDDNTVVNIAYNSVVGIQCPGAVGDSTVTVNGSAVTVTGGGRWIDIEEMDRSLIDDLDD